MTISIYVMLISGALSAIFFLLFRAEALAGRRYILSGLREQADQALNHRMKGRVMLKRYFSASSFRLFLHFLLHQTLSIALATIKAVEGHLNHLRRHNRLAARNVETVRDDNHLQHIAKHKESVALSSEEKEELKERSLND